MTKDDLVMRSVNVASAWYAGLLGRIEGGHELQPMLRRGQTALSSRGPVSSWARESFRLRSRSGWFLVIRNLLPITDHRSQNREKKNHKKKPKKTVVFTCAQTLVQRCCRNTDNPNASDVDNATTFPVAPTSPSYIPHARGRKAARENFKTFLTFWAFHFHLR